MPMTPSLPQIHNITMQGIVNAVRELGGRFLEVDERTGRYTDIGDKKATEKTSQALREGQTKIRKDIHQGQDDTSPPLPQLNVEGEKEISNEGYFGYSVQVLESLYHAEDNITSETRQQGGQLHTRPWRLGMQQSPVSAAYMTAVLDQFDGMTPVQHHQPPQQQEKETHRTDMPPPAPMMSHVERGTLSSWSLSSSSLGMRDTISSRLTGNSFMSTFSNAHANESTMEAATTPGGGRGSADSVTAEIMELLQQSEPELMHIQGMNMDDMLGLQHDPYQQQSSQQLAVSAAHMTAVLDQFDGMTPVQHQPPQQQEKETHRTDMPPPAPILSHHSRSHVERGTLSSWSLSSSSVGMQDTFYSRLTGNSFMSTFSNTHTNESGMNMDDVLGLQHDPYQQQSLQQPAVSSANMTAVLDQFDGMVPVPH